MLNRTAACFAVLLMALCSGCASGEAIDPDSTIELGSSTCEYEGDLRPTLAPPERTLGEQYGAPLRHELRISSALPVANQEAIVLALDAVRDFTGGWVDLTPVITDTTCDEAWAVHGAEQGDCHLTHTDGWRVGWYQGSPFRIAVRTTTAEGGVPAANESFIAALHELGHALGLGHTGGANLMHRSLGVQVASPVLRSSQAAAIAAHYDWPAEELTPGRYDYWWDRVAVVAAEE